MENQRIEERIEQLRNEMIDTGMELGLCHPSTVALSQELDELLNQFEKQKMRGDFNNGRAKFKRIG